jgi:hypothetical protein
MLYFGDIFAWISTNGITNECFAIEQPASNCITCWIASESGKVGIFIFSFDETKFTFFT